MASLLLLSDSDSWHGRQNITECFKLGHKPNMSENMIHDVTLLGHKYEMDMIVDWESIYYHKAFNRTNDHKCGMCKSVLSEV